jgi:phosphate transport system substrate-binding protein
MQVRGAGSTFVAPLMQRWIDVYQDDHTDVAIHYDAVGSGAGIDRFIAGKVDFGASDAAMNDKEIASVQPPAGRGVILIPITAGEVVIAYNLRGFDAALHLPRDVYADIFLGKITRWDDPRIAQANPGVQLPPRMIQVIARRDSSGTTFAFTNHLSSISRDWQEGPGTGKLIDWPGSAMSATGNEGVAQRLRITENAIGYLEYGFARRLGLTMAVLQNRAGEFISPGPASGIAALGAAAENIPPDLRLFLPDPPGNDAYPILSLTWLLLHRVYPESGKGTALKQALDWSLGEGQTIAEEMGYIPLPDNIVDLSRQVLNEIH